MKLQPIILTAVLAMSDMAFSTAHAAAAKSVEPPITEPKKIVPFNPTSPTNTLKVKSTSWRDTASGKGSTGDSGWGKFSASEGRIIRIKLTSTTVGLHPGITVWYRGPCNTAPGNYVDNASYVPSSNIFKYKKFTIDKKTVTKTICMQVAAYGYDQDGHKLRPPALHGLGDKVQGQITLTFIAPQTGDYVFAVGGINPAKTVSSKILHDISTTISVTRPK